MQILNRKIRPETFELIWKGAVGVVVWLALIAILSVSAHAQQTVFNVPTTDVLDKGKVYFELDISAKPNDAPALNKFSSFVPRIVVGTGSRVEVGLNITGNIQPGTDSTTLVPAFKFKAYDGKDNGWAIALGTHVYIPVHNRAYDTGNHTYMMVQKSFKSKARIGFGGGVFSRDVVAPNAIRGAGMFTLEQPVTDKFGLAADWYTGKHASGYSTYGGYYKLTKKLTGYAAYSVGNANASHGNQFMYFEVGYNFN